MFFHLTYSAFSFLYTDFKTAWLGLANSKEQYVLRYESKYLTQIGSAMDYMVDVAIKSASMEALKYTVLSGDCQQFLLDLHQITC